MTVRASLRLAAVPAGASVVCPDMAVPRDGGKGFLGLPGVPVPLVAPGVKFGYLSKRPTCRSGLFVETGKEFGDDRRSLLAFDLDGGVDLDLGTALYLGDFGNGGLHPYFRADLD